MDTNFEIYTRNKSIQSLPQALLSLIGSKNNLTPCWVESVSDIINDLQSAQKVGYPILKEEIQEKMEMLSSVDGEVEASVSKIEDELSSLNAQLDELMVQRRDVLNEYLDLKGNIRVFCRIRPFLPQESFGFQKSIFDLDSSNVFMRIAETKCKKYNFDKVFSPSSTQEEVFSEIEPVIKSALDGYNVCIFAYGQTGTGKTYTMDGTLHNPGMVPRGIKSMFNQAEERNCEFIFNFSMLEIYMGNLKDLLAPAKQSNFQKPPSLLIKTDSDGDIDIENLVAIQVNNFGQVKKLYNIGTRLRSTGSTMANSTSSRSHCLIRITLTSIGARERISAKNKLWMVDLGGSERLLKTQASGKRLEEGKAINLSLSALADVIDALQTKKAHVPFRNSKLTQVLRDSLGSDSKTLMLVHASPNEDDFCETICTFGFAMRVRSIRFEKEEPLEVRAKKEQSIADVELEMKQLEKESQELQMKIKDLNEKLQELKGVQISDADSNFSYPCSEGIGISQNFTKTSSRVPGFMKPTACSQRKIESHQISLNHRRKKPPLPTKKRPASVYAESIIYPVKEFTCKSDCVSECSISTLEYEVKEVIFPQEEKSPRNGNSLEEKGIEKWLSVQVAESSSNYNQWNKRVMSIPVERWNKNNVDENSKDVIELIEEPNEKQDMDYQADKSKQGINKKACFEENDMDITLPVPVNSKYYQEENSDKESGTDMSVTKIFLEYKEEMLPGERKDTEVEMEETKLENEIGKYKILRHFQTMWASAILGSGIGSIGIGNDFFTALIL